MKIGAHIKESETCEFTVWAPFLKELSLKIYNPNERIIQMNKDTEGYWSAVVGHVSSGSKYSFSSKEFQNKPDPASFSQPDGVHGPSQVVDHHAFQWHDQSWKGLKLSDMIIYEVHVGTFTEEGTFQSIIPRLKDLKEAGINAIELMPVGQFPGQRNWGYDGVEIFAVQNSYGGPEGLKGFVDACHQEEIAVILDVVYNHLGPEGNYLSLFGPYFTSKYSTPWGSALNFDDGYSHDVRNFFIENAICWSEYYHIDALRLDAVHAIYDGSAKPFLQELGERVKEHVKETGRNFYLIAESDLNDVRIVKSGEEGGIGLDAQWSDDFHHCVHSLLTKETGGYYADFGQLEDLKRALTDTFVYAWQYSKFRKKYHGNSAKDASSDKFVVCIQNHDQVGNRLLGDRLATIVSFEALKLAAGTMLLSPYVPLIFMGEEHAEESPFLYFVHHSEEELIKAVREGRKREFESFQWKGEIPDPQDEKTFIKSKVNWKGRLNGHHGVMLKYYKWLIHLRRGIPALNHLNKESMDIKSFEKQNVLIMRRWHQNDECAVFLNFDKSEQTFPASLTNGNWKNHLDSSDKNWQGPGSLLKEEITATERITMQPLSCAVYQKEI